MSDGKQFELSSKLATLLSVFLVGLFVFWGFRIYEIINQAEGNYPREISVEGTGKAFIVPDTAKLTFGVNTRAETSAEAVTQGTKDMNAVIKALTDLGVEREDIRTVNYYLNPNYEYIEGRGSEQKGYILDQSIEVKTEDFESVGQMISKATEVGANVLGGVQFVVENPDAAKSEARRQALENAKAKAKEIEEASGLKLGKLLSYYEYSPYGGDFDYGRGGAMMEGAMMDSGGAMAPMVEPGQQEVQLTVTLNYRVK